MHPRTPSRPRAVFPWITLGLCLAMLAVHVLVGPSGTDPAQSPQRLALLDAGAKSASLVSDAGEGWRVLSAHLVHTGWLHLMFNLAFFFPVAAALECVLLRVDFSLTLALIAICSGLASLVWTPEISAGASGLVYGVLGCAVLVGLRFAAHLRGRVRLHFGLWVLPFLLLILFFGANNPNLDHHNHLGGLTAGLCVVPFVRLRPRYLGPHAAPPKAHHSMLRALAVTGLVMLTVSGAPALVRALHPAQTLPCMGTYLHLPPSWTPPAPADLCLQDPLARGPEQVTIANSSTMVSLGLAKIPDGANAGSWPEAWHHYLPILLDPSALDSLRAWSGSCAQASQDRSRSFCDQQLRFIRDGVWMRAQLHWYRREGHWLCVHVETPLHWWDKYGPTREAILSSVHRGSKGPGASTIARAAIP